MSRSDPVCTHGDVSVADWDHGRDPETGYLDEGCRVTCRVCGEVFDGPDWERELRDQDRDRRPQPGDVYTQFGARLIVIDVDQDKLHYVCRNENATSPARAVPLDHFLRDLSQGFVARVSRERD
jgi:hypothetical protein